jgi:hypothetical protein
MNIRTYGRFSDAIAMEKGRLKTFARSVRAPYWQGMDVSAKPEMMTRELLNESFAVQVLSLDELRDDIKPNLPWADDHFAERVGRAPINPGVQWANWPFAKSAARFLKEQWRQVHAHVYGAHLAEVCGRCTGRWSYHRSAPRSASATTLGDLDDVVRLLARDPLTRQAYLPIFFPEDTGAVHGGRIPCSIGYQFILRDSYLHCIYQLRSCDFVRHLRDDLYLASRLLLWVLEELQAHAGWDGISPGLLTTHITSLHIFEADVRALFHDDEATT